MKHMVNKAYARWVAANLISGHLVHAGNHKHGTAGHRQGQCTYDFVGHSAAKTAFTLPHRI